MRAIIVSTILLVSAYNGNARAATAPRKANEAMKGATSPTGEQHPGKIVYEDKVAGRVWTEHAEDLPQSVAWAEIDGKWIPVLKIRMTGSASRREITSYGPNDKFLKTTVLTQRPRR